MTTIRLGELPETIEREYNPDDIALLEANFGTMDIVVTLKDGTREHWAKVGPVHRARWMRVRPALLGTKND